MDELRLSLLTLFVVLIAGIYLRETLRKRGAARAQAHTPNETSPAATSPEVATSEVAMTEALVADASQVHDITAGEPAYLDPTPAPDAKLNAFSQAATPVDDHEEWPAYISDEDDACAVEAFSQDGRDVPLGDIELLHAERLLGDADLRPANDEASLEAALREVGEEPFRQGQLDLDWRTPRHEPTLSPDASSARPSDELIVVLHVMRADWTDLPASSVQAALGTAQLELGEMSIYHHYGLTFGGAQTPVFSVARAVEPGTFDADDESTYAAPGLTLFMRLPGPQDGAVVLELMFNMAQTLARDLDAGVLDERRNPLSAQALNHLRERVAEFTRRHKLVGS